MAQIEGMVYTFHVLACERTETTFLDLLDRATTRRSPRSGACRGRPTETVRAATVAAACYTGCLGAGQSGADACRPPWPAMTSGRAGMSSPARREVARWPAADGTPAVSQNTEK